MNHTLQDTIKNLPEQPGIYQYFDKDKRLLYVGKAKSLKNRVKSYFRFAPILSAAPTLSTRIKKMIQETENIEYIVLKNEHDALILENSLIKQLKPKYNILLRDDKTYPYIYIDLKEEFPRFEITRKVIKGKNIKYFGPFSTSAREIYDSLYDLFPLVQKKGCLKSKKKCLFYEIKKCPAPCEKKISKDDYRKIVTKAISYINDKKALIGLLEDKMQKLSKKLLFEEAARIRDRIEKIKKSQISSEIDIAKLENLDIFAIAADKNRACILRLFMRDGKITSTSHSFLRSDSGFDYDEMYKRALLEFYSNPLPMIAKKILIPSKFAQLKDVQKFISEKFDRKIAVFVPQRGEKRKLTELALKNAKELLKIKKEQNSDDLLVSIKELFSLQKTPYVIEAFDNSHMQGSAPTGAQIVWEDGFVKTRYRHYNLQSLDEYSQMKELLSKRCQSFEKNPPPDLWIIDGGETLLKLAYDIAQSFGVDIDIIAIAKEKIDSIAHRAKGKAKDILYSKQKSFKLETNDKRLQFIQKLRDEAHRFALKFHRNQKLKIDKEISLLKKKGIGEAKVKKLLNYFGTFENIKNADFDELSKVIDKKSATILLA
jgi:excinuclease ABC subunit C